jgi:hypothetical protein
MNTTTLNAPETIRNGVNVTKLGQTIDAIRQQPEIAQFKFRARNQWDNGGHNPSTPVERSAEIIARAKAGPESRASRPTAARRPPASRIRVPSAFPTR